MTPKLSEKICFHSTIFKNVLELHNNLLRSPIIHGFLQISPLILENMPAVHNFIKRSQTSQ
jgi:hypothetical protein